MLKEGIWEEAAGENNAAQKHGDVSGIRWNDGSTVASGSSYSLLLKSSHLLTPIDKRVA
jgi:hypothetical protein